MQLRNSIYFSENVKKNPKNTSRSIKNSTVLEETHKKQEILTENLQDIDVQKKAISPNPQRILREKDRKMRLKDYLLITHTAYKNSGLKSNKSNQKVEKNEKRKEKYRVDHQKVIQMLNTQIEEEISQIIQNLQLIKEQALKPCVSSQQRKPQCTHYEKKRLRQLMAEQLSRKNTLKDLLKQRIKGNLKQILTILKPNEKTAAQQQIDSPRISQAKSLEYLSRAR